MENQPQQQIFKTGDSADLLVTPVRFDDKTYHKISAISDSCNMKVSTIIRSAIQEWLDDGDNRPLTGLGSKVSVGKSISVRLPENLLRELEAIEDGDLSRSEMIRCAVRSWVARNESKMVPLADERGE